MSSDLGKMPLLSLASWIKNNYKVDGVIILTIEEENDCFVMLNSIGLDDRRIQDVLAQGIYLNRRDAIEEHLKG